jgi:hypothetical protein
MLSNYMWMHIYVLDDIFVVHFVSTIIVNNYQRQCHKL